MADEEKAPKPAKVKLTDEERRARVREARAAKVDEVFKGRSFDYVEKVSLPEGDRYTDVTGNKGRHGHKIRDKKTGEELIVGPASLTALAEQYKGISLPEKPSKEKVEASA